MKFKGSRIIYDDPWENELSESRIWASILEEDHEVEKIKSHAMDISQGDWNNILKIREYFTKQFVNQYKQRNGKVEIMRAFHAKRIFESILILFCGGHEGMQRSQDLLIRDCEKRHRYVVKELHATITTPSREGDIALAYEDITHNSR